MYRTVTWKLQNVATGVYVGKINNKYVEVTDPNDACCFVSAKAAASTAASSLPKSLQHNTYDVKSYVNEVENNSKSNSNYLRSNKENQFSEDVVDIIESMSAVLDAFIKIQDLVTHKSNIDEELTAIENEIIDIEHYIEFNDLNACAGYEIYKKLQDARIRRRHCKDRLALVDLATNYNLNFSSVFKVIDGINSMNNRNYKIRTDTSI